MTVHYFLFTFLLFTRVLLGQQQGVSNTDDSFNNQLYFSRVDSLCHAIDSFIRENGNSIQVDTIELEGNYKTNSSTGFLITKIDTVHFDRISKAVVITHNKKILKILLPTEPINNSWGLNLDSYYFSDNQLLSSVIKCADLGARMGSCGGVYSTYYNYFSNNQCQHLKVVENTATQFCGCGQSYVPTVTTVENWMLTIEAYLGE